MDWTTRPDQDVREAAAEGIPEAVAEARRRWGARTPLEEALDTSLKGY